MFGLVCLLNSAKINAMRTSWVALFMAKVGLIAHQNHDKRGVDLTDFPGSCTTQANARLSTPKIHQKRHFQAFIS
jgi:hypothetical protein